MFIRTFSLLMASCMGIIATAQVSESPSRTIHIGKAEVTALAVSPKADRLLVGTNNGAVLQDIESGKKVYAYTYEEDGGTAVYHVGFNDNGELAVLIGHSGKRTVWKVTDGKQEKVITTHRWIPDPRAVKAMGLDMSNSTFDRFYQQKEVRIGDVTVRSGKKGIVEFVDADGKVTRTLTFPENKDQHHMAPLLIWEKYLLIGTDNGNVLFYDVL
jgi:WD40 repeat protein